MLLRAFGLMVELVVILGGCAFLFSINAVTF